MQSIFLTVNPTSGPAPLIVNFSATVASDVQFDGYVFVTVFDTIIKHHPPTFLFADAVSIAAGATVTVTFPPFVSGISGHTYRFLGLLEDETAHIVATSEPVFVTVS